MNVFKYVEFWYPKTGIDQNSSAMDTFEASIYKKLIFNGHERPFWGNGPVCLVYQYFKRITMKCVGSVTILIVISMINLPRFILYGAEGGVSFSIWYAKLHSAVSM